MRKLYTGFPSGNSSLQSLYFSKICFGRLPQRGKWPSRFQQGFKARQYLGPTISDSLQHLGAGLKAIVNNRQVHYTPNRFNQERDSGVLVLACFIGRKSPRQNKTAWRGKLNDLSDQSTRCSFSRFRCYHLEPGCQSDTGELPTSTGRSDLS